MTKSQPIYPPQADAKPSIRENGWVAGGLAVLFFSPWIAWALFPRDVNVGEKETKTPEPAPKIELVSAPTKQSSEPECSEAITNLKKAVLPANEQRELLAKEPFVPTP